MTDKIYLIPFEEIKSGSLSIYRTCADYDTNINANEEYILPKDTYTDTIYGLDDEMSFRGFVVNKITDIVTILKNDKSFTGTFIRGDSESISFMVNNLVTTIRNYDSYVMRNSEAYTIKFTLSDDKVKAEIIRVKFLTGSITWTPLVTVLIDDNDDNKAYIRLAASIKNIGNVFDGKITLVTGDIMEKINTDRSETKQMKMASSMAFKSTQHKEKSMPEIGELSDHITYDLGHQTIKKSTSGCNVIELDTKYAEYKNMYFSTINVAESLSYGFRIKTDIFLPASTVNVNMITNNSPTGSYIGSYDIPDTNADTDFDVIIGRTSKVSVKYDLTEKETLDNISESGQPLSGSKQSNKITTGTVTIKNNSKHEANLVISKNIYDKMTKFEMKLISGGTSKLLNYKINSGYLETHIDNIPIGETLVYSLTLNTSSKYY